ncbi:MAG: hypothetical protein ACI8YO_002837, partial [Gammaproteobacteria bacterium]
KKLNCTAIKGCAVFYFEELNCNESLSSSK